jgi:hypothetical protein
LRRPDRIADPVSRDITEGLITSPHNLTLRAAQR